MYQTDAVNTITKHTCLFHSKKSCLFEKFIINGVMGKRFSEAVHKPKLASSLLQDRVDVGHSVLGVHLCIVVFCTRPEDPNKPVAASKYFEENKNALPKEYESYAFFNPLYKKMESFSHIDKQVALIKIRETISEIDVREVIVPAALRNDQSTTAKQSILDVFKDTTEIRIIHTDFEDEIQRYLNYKMTEDDITLFQWWKDHKSEFPRLYKRFLEIAGIPASSAPCERLFSSAGNFLTVKRNRLETNKLFDLLFMYMNNE